MLDAIAESTIRLKAMADEAHALVERLQHRAVREQLNNLANTRVQTVVGDPGSRSRTSARWRRREAQSLTL